MTASRGHRVASLIVGAVLASHSTGCVSIYAHSVSSGTSAAGTPVEARDEGLSVLMLWAPDLEARPELVAKCPSGKLSNVESVGWMRNWFGMVQIYELRVRASCER